MAALRGDPDAGGGRGHRRRAGLQRGRRPVLDRRRAGRRASPQLRRRMLAFYRDWLTHPRRWRSRPSRPSTGPRSAPGCAVALACDIRYAATTARLGVPVHLARACTPVWRRPGLLPEVAGLAVARDLLLTGRIVDGEEAVRAGPGLAGAAARARAGRGARRGRAGGGRGAGRDPATTVARCATAGTRRSRRALQWEGAGPGGHAGHARTSRRASPPQLVGARQGPAADVTRAPGCRADAARMPDGRRGNSRVEDACRFAAPGDIGSPREPRIDRGPAQPPPAPHRQRLPRGRRAPIVLIPAAFTAAEEPHWVDADAGPAGGRRPAPRVPRRASSPRGPAELSRRYLGGARPPDQRALGRSTRTRRWGSCTPSDGTIRVSDRLKGMPGLRARLRAAARARPPAACPATAGLLAPARVLPAHRARPRLPRGGRAPRRAACQAPRIAEGDADRRARRPTTLVTEPPAVSRAPAAARAAATSGASSAPRCSGAARRPATTRTSSDSSLTRGRAPVGRHGGVAHVEVLAAARRRPRPARAGRAAPAGRRLERRRCRTPRGPRGSPPPAR